MMTDGDLLFPDMQCTNNFPLPSVLLPRALLLIVLVSLILLLLVLIDSMMAKHSSNGGGDELAVW